ncbi:MAG: hypothetical protein ACXVGA_04320, partial [Mycobacteriaceae bacterium]
IHDIACTTFTFTCPWGCTVQVEEGREVAHHCAGTSAILDALHDAHHGRGNLTMLQLAEHVARQLDPTVRVLKADSWETGVRDGRSGETFAGIDPESPGERQEDADV